MQPLQDMQICDDSKEGLHDVKSFVGACNFYQRHIQNFFCCPAPLTNLIKKTTPWIWTFRGEECFEEPRKKIASSDFLRVKSSYSLMLVIWRWVDCFTNDKDLDPADLTHCHYCT